MNVDTTSDAIKLIAKAKKPHKIHGEDGEVFPITEGQEIVAILSNKWNLDTYKKILRAAGINSVHTYGPKNSGHKIISAKVEKDPDLRSLLKPR